MSITFQELPQLIKNKLSNYSKRRDRLYKMNQFHRYFDIELSNKMQLLEMYSSGQFDEYKIYMYILFIKKANNRSLFYYIIFDERYAIDMDMHLTLDYYYWVNMLDNSNNQKKKSIYLSQYFSQIQSSMKFFDNKKDAYSYFSDLIVTSKGSGILQCPNNYLL